MTQIVTNVSYVYLDENVNDAIFQRQNERRLVQPLSISKRAREGCIECAGIMREIFPYDEA